MEKIVLIEYIEKYQFLSKNGQDKVWHNEKTAKVKGLRCNRLKFLSFWVISCPFSPLMTWKIKILKLKKKTWKYYHFTHLHHKWQSYDVYGSWDMEHDGQNFLSIWIVFCPFAQLKTQKIKILKKWKNAWRYYHFTHM